MGLGGLEPPASPLSGVRSNQLSYRPEPIENCYRQLVVPGPAIKELQLAIIKVPFILKKGNAVSLIYSIQVI